mmetsp:Transcript_3473/g.9203  ORF Transcript_3473/g.9203 Transcript_3473/m.9203 type:complete len:247 (-) Transcript_3473:51-791(-)
MLVLLRGGRCFHAAVTVRIVRPGIQASAQRQDSALPGEAEGKGVGGDEPLTVEGVHQRGLVVGQPQYPIGVLLPKEAGAGRLASEGIGDRQGWQVRLDALRYVRGSQPDHVLDLRGGPRRSLRVLLRECARSGTVAASSPSSSSEERTGGDPLQKARSAGRDDVGGRFGRVEIGAGVRPAAVAAIRTGDAGKGHGPGSRVDDQGLPLRGRSDVQLGVVGPRVRVQGDRRVGHRNGVGRGSRRKRRR